MGTWSANLFDDDMALDIQDEFEALIEEGLTVKEATKEILDTFEDALADDDDGPIIYLALAALQLEKGAVQDDIKKMALDIIDTGKGLERWEEAGKDKLDKRIKVLNDLKAKLINN